MKTVLLAICGWLIPGGAYLVLRRYVQFGIFAAVVSVTFAAGLALDGGSQWPLASDLTGLDGFTALLFQAGALVKWFAGAPFLLARLLDGGSAFLGGRLHEYGSTLLVLAGVFNLLAVSSALDLRDAESAK